MPERSNPRTPEEALSAYYVVPKGKAKVLRYPPQHADWQTDDYQTAQKIRLDQKALGESYRIYNAAGEDVTKGRTDAEKDRWKRTSTESGPLARMFAEAGNVGCIICKALPGEPCTGFPMGGPGVHNARLQAGWKLANKNSLKALADAGEIPPQLIDSGPGGVSTLPEYAASDVAAVQAIGERHIAEQGGRVETPFEIATELIRQWTVDLPVEVTDATVLELNVQQLRGLLIEAATQNGWAQTRRMTKPLKLGTEAEETERTFRGGDF